VEPPTHNLLNRGAYEFTPEDVKSMFPKGSTKKHKAYSLELQQTTSALRELKQESKERKPLEKRCLVLKSAISQIDKDKGNLRIDLELRDSHTAQDTTVIHPTCKSHKRAEAKKMASLDEFQRVLRLQVRAANEEEKGEGTEERRKGREERKKREEEKKKREKREGKRVQPGNTVAKQEQHKVETYAPLVRIATEQHEKGKREVLPVFLPLWCLRWERKDQTLCR
jgi:hypothetical protein